MRILGLFLAPSLVLGFGCTHWDMQPVYGPPQEVGRHLIGAPQVETTTSTDFSAGGVTSSAPGYAYGYYGGGRVTSGQVSGDGETVTRTHCVQQAQIDYLQPYTLQPVTAGRAWDVLGGVGLGLLGGSIALVANQNYNDQLSVDQTNPAFFGTPSPPTGAYAIGGALLVGGIAWLGYSLLELPSGPEPQPQNTQQTYTQVQYVESTGCGLVPGDQAHQ
jgi:hypothetical protein